MTHFNVLVDANNMLDDDLKSVVSCLSSLLYSFTSKHQRKTIFSFDIEENRIAVLRNFCELQEISDFVVVVDAATVGDMAKNFAVYVDFVDRVPLDSIMSMMSFGVPFLGLVTPDRKENLDNTCSILIPNKASVDTYSEVSTYLRMLYFDPEVRKILKKGALKNSKSGVTILK